jgi:hypothetical protein
MRARGLGGVHNSGIGTFADAGSGVFLVGHIWLHFVLFQLACGTRRWRNREKNHPVWDGSWKSELST